MRTVFNQKQLTLILELYCFERGAAVNFLQYLVDDDGSFSGVMIDHDVELARAPIVPEQ